MSAKPKTGRAPAPLSPPVDLPEDEPIQTPTAPAIGSLPPVPVVGSPAIGALDLSTVPSLQDKAAPTPPPPPPRHHKALHVEATTSPVPSQLPPPPPALDPVAGATGPAFFEWAIAHATDSEFLRLYAARERFIAWCRSGKNTSHTPDVVSAFLARLDRLASQP